MLLCKHCDKECKNDNSLRNHQRLCKSNPDRIESPFVAYNNKVKSGEIEIISWRKGKTKDTDPQVAYWAEQQRLKFARGELSPPTHTADQLSKFSELAKKRNLGGYRPHPNRGQRYKDIWFDSKWEVAVAKSLDEHNVRWERPKVGFVWSDAGNRYYPDFYLPDYNVYLDPKNDFLIKKDKIKIDQAQIRNNIKVIVLNKTQLQWECIQTLVPLR